MPTMELMSADNPVLRLYVICSAILALKMMLMSPLTSRQRRKHGVFVNKEDAEWRKKEVKANNEHVERVRRAHLNDVENIPVFWALGGFYVMTDPSLFVAGVCFWVFTGARVLHSVAYLHEMMPHRFLVFLLGMTVNIYMGFSCARHFW